MFAAIDVELVVVFVVFFKWIDTVTEPVAGILEAARARRCASDG